LWIAWLVEPAVASASFPGKGRQVLLEPKQVAAVQDSSLKIKSVAYRVLVLEAVITGVIALVLFLAVNMELATSVVIGGLAFIIPNAYFAKYVFRYSAADSPRLAVRWLYLGEVVKVIATVMIFAIGFLLVERLNVPALFIAYMSMLLLNLIGNAILMDKQHSTAGDTEK
jgi:ATP synthase protein I